LTQEVGTAWFDDMFLIEAPADISNMLLNGSFDGREIARGWPQWWFSALGSPATPGQVGSDNPLWGTDDSAAFQGQKSFRLVNPGITQPQPGFGFPNVKQELPRGTLLQKGKSYVLSAYMKADPPNLHTIMYAGDFGLHKEVRVGPDWQRYVARVTPERDHGGYPFVMFDLRQPGKLWIDAVQFEEGTEPTDFNEWRLDAPSGRSGPPEVDSTRAKEPSKSMAEPAAPVPAEPVASGAKPNELSEKKRRDAKIRHFGYLVWDGPPSLVPEIAPYTNVVVDVSWLRLGHGVLEAASKARLRAVLVILAKERDGIEDRLFATIEKYRDTVRGIYWAGPLITGYGPSQISEFTNAVKRRFPGIEIWVSVQETGAESEGPRVPPEVDGIVVVGGSDRTPEAVRAKTDDVLPKWREKAGNREILLNWHTHGGPKGGLVPHYQPGTLRACVEAAKKHRLAGLLFTSYDDSKDRGTVGIHARPELVDEIKRCAEELGFGPRAAPK
jgi:hypothetical protein